MCKLETHFHLDADLVTSQFHANEIAAFLTARVMRVDVSGSLSNICLHYPLLADVDRITPAERPRQNNHHNCGGHLYKRLLE